MMPMFLLCSMYCPNTVIGNKETSQTITQENQCVPNMVRILYSLNMCMFCCDSAMNSDGGQSIFAFSHVNLNMWSRFGYKRDLNSTDDDGEIAQTCTWFKEKSNMKQTQANTVVKSCRVTVELHTLHTSAIDQREQAIGNVSKGFKHS